MYGYASAISEDKIVCNRQNVYCLLFLKFVFLHIGLIKQKNRYIRDSFAFKKNTSSFNVYHTLPRFGGLIYAKRTKLSFLCKFRTKFEFSFHHNIIYEKIPYTRTMPQ